MYNGRHIFLISGPGESGKDTLARMLSRLLHMHYNFSTSFGASHAFWHSIKRGEQEHRGLTKTTYMNMEHFYADRINKRKEWADFISELNQNDPAGLYRYCLDKGNDFLIGIRKESELNAVESEGWIDFRIWIETPGKKDETQEYGPERCDISIINVQNGLDGLRRKVLTALRFLQFPATELYTAHSANYMDKAAIQYDLFQEQAALARLYHEYNSQAYRENRERAAQRSIPHPNDSAIADAQASH